MIKHEMKILGKTIPLSNDLVNIHDLKFLIDNPRVYACTRGKPGFDNLMEEEQQKIIFEKLKEESSVKKLIPDVKRHGGLMESILIRHDTMEVIEGNSRLAVYLQLHEEGAEGEWELIPCSKVSNLTDDQKVAFLNQIHVKGKTKWSAYEKANFAYVHWSQGRDYDQIAQLFGVSIATIRFRVAVIKKMQDNNDNLQSHFSYYEVLVRNSEISKAMKEREDLSDFLLPKIKRFSSNDEDNDFTAQELRKCLPVILKKPKVLTKYIDHKIGFDDAYQTAKISHVEEKIKQAKMLLDDVTKNEVLHLEQSSFAALKQHVKKLSQAIKRINGIVEERTQSSG